MIAPALRTAPVPQTRFALPPGSEAAGPPERHGIPRDGVRLLVARPAGLEHRRFHELPELLAPGDLVVVNTSATLPAALDAQADGGPVVVHVAAALDDGSWVVEVRRTDGSGPQFGIGAGSRLDLPGSAGLQLLDPYPDPMAVGPNRLWRAAATSAVPAGDFLARYGRPISYRYLAGRYPLADYQTVYAAEPGSAEMASAGRPFTAAVLVRLMARGVPVAPLVLHAGVSSFEPHEPPSPERYLVPAVTARLVEATRAAGGRVVAVGTTVVRALETATGADGVTRAARGWTDLVLCPDRPVRVVTGLVTGLHAPEASHLLLLEAVAGAELVGQAYRAAVERRYRWHEFGDSTLLLPGLPGA